MSILKDIVDNRKKAMQEMPDITGAKPCAQNFMDIFNEFAIIAEVKHRSPSEGDIVDEYDPVRIASIYELGQASAISVLTEPDYFGGGFIHLANIDAAVEIPLLCKDFIVAKKQIHMARVCGAAACLLIVAALPDEELLALKQEIESLGMVAVIEVFNAEEIERALKLDPQVIQINNRNLKSFDVNMENSGDLSAMIPESIKVIAASGLKKPEDVQNYPERIDGALVGTALMKSTAKVTFLEELRALKS